MDRKEFRCFSERIARLECSEVRFKNIVAELLAQPSFGGRGRSAVEPAKEPECEEVLAAIGFSLRER